MYDGPPPQSPSNTFESTSSARDALAEPHGRKKERLSAEPHLPSRPPSAGFHTHRVAGGHGHHRSVDGVVAAGGAVRARGLAPHAVQRQPEGNRAGRAQ